MHVTRVSSCVTLFIAALSFTQDDEVFLEAQVQNITSSSMVMESVKLEPSAVYSVTDLNAMPADQKRDVSGYVKPTVSIAKDKWIFISCVGYVGRDPL